LLAQGQRMALRCSPRASAWRCGRSPQGQRMALRSLAPGPAHGVAVARPGPAHGIASLAPGPAHGVAVARPRASAWRCGRSPQGQRVETPRSAKIRRKPLLFSVVVIIYAHSR
jgi:hypothetical protein